MTMASILKQHAKRIMDNRQTKKAKLSSAVSDDGGRDTVDLLETAKKYRDSVVEKEKSIRALVEKTEIELEKVKCELEQYRKDLSDAEREVIDAEKHLKKKLKIVEMI